MDDQTYQEAADILGKIQRRESSLRSLVFGSHLKVLRSRLKGKIKIEKISAYFVPNFV